ncbi:TPA: alpha-D-ribose 1-methylphosphonate 5-triphosphate diphosphatase [Clostridioides difficile]|nr:alpha-D-ribose 1-methylphosphonate 5-triphosphate diphosphatase [Clostridioides difficile]
MIKLIHNANIVLEDMILENGHLIIEGDTIKKVSNDRIDYAFDFNEIDEIIDAKNLYVIPGIIDIHSDAIEKEIEPRPSTLLPFNMAFYELDKKLPENGITTVYHSISLGDGVGVRSIDNSLKMIKNIDSYKNIDSKSINHKVHLRYEVLYYEGLEKVLELLDENKIDYLSIMDHSPGQGQYTNPTFYKEYATKVWGVTENYVDTWLDDLVNLHDNLDWNKIANIIGIAKTKNINVASHDDDTLEKMDFIKNIGINVSEFPITLEVAKHSKKLGVLTCLGAPNIVRGKSHNNNLKAMDAILEDCCDIVCSDYLPSAMIKSMCIVAERINNLNKAVSLFTSNPAKAVGIYDERGSIKENKKADLVLVDIDSEYPKVVNTIVNGKTVYKREV